jgi:hypothetical protein
MPALLVGLGILTTALFPIALPGLLLFVVAPLMLVAVVGLLLAVPLGVLLLPVWLVRRSRLSPVHEADVGRHSLEPGAVDRLAP